LFIHPLHLFNLLAHHLLHLVLHPDVGEEEEEEEEEEKEWIRSGWRKMTCAKAKSGRLKTSIVYMQAPAPK